ncbi:sporulation-delaying protein SdpB family protein [Flavobacterium aquidurense]|uniref:sporulation-delaying protein SdpB family protein n=1 Tax=Flavobacterium aquidurense TaxID=362413 RepID=UPI002862E19D|nr:sporulation-delaying protein SdpB family protein [Flavobacterium aquidurense]MDR7371996.1 antimicrobial peptide system SdpB family protein [Flavobacterium aquidurense]
MIKKINNQIKTSCLTLFPYTNTVGFARSILALGTLLTLIFNPIGILFHKKIDGTILNPLLNPVIPINKYNFFTLFGFDNIVYMKGLAILILIITISGYFIKITSLLHWWICISFLYFSSIIDGGDQIASILSFLLIPFCLTDLRKNHWQYMQPYDSALNIIGLFSIWIIRIQVAIIYYHASLGKLSVPEWVNGTAIYYWFNHSVFGMPTSISIFMNKLLSNPVIISLLTYSVIVLEILLFLGLLASLKYRKTILCFGILFHFFIIIYHGIFSFFFSICAALILFLYPTYQSINFKLWSLKK